MPKVAVTDQKSGLQPGGPPESEPNRPEKGPEFRSFAESPLEAFLNPPKRYLFQAVQMQGFSVSS